MNRSLLNIPVLDVGLSGTPLVSLKKTGPNPFETRLSVAQVQPDEMHLTFVGAEGQKLYSYTRQRRRNHAARPLGSAGGRAVGLAGGGSAKRMNTKNVRLAACMKRCVVPSTRDPFSFQTVVSRSQETTPP